MTDDAEATLARLFDRLALRNDDRRAPRRRVDDEVWRPIRDKLVERNVHVPFEQKVISGMLVGVSDVDHAANGMEVHIPGGRRRIWPRVKPTIGRPSALQPINGATPPRPGGKNTRR